MGSCRGVVACLAVVMGLSVAPAQALTLADVTRVVTTGLSKLTNPVSDIVVPPDVAGYEASSTARAHALQFALGHDVGLRNAQWFGTHNAFNSPAEMGPTLSANDSNQRLTPVDQLRIGLRSLELDVHWWLNRPTVCHATGPHIGCTLEKPLRTVLTEIAGWLRTHRDQPVLLYLEDHLDNQTGYDAGAAVVREVIGDLVHLPPSSGAACDELDLDTSRDDVLAAGKQVVIVSDCGLGSRWRGVAHRWDAHVEQRPRGYQAFPGCGPDYPRATYDATLVRYYEDSTFLTATASLVGAASTDDGITPATARAMVDCGVDLIGLDQVVPADGRLPALLWSWLPGEPSTGDCAARRADGRWVSLSCAAGLLRAACRAADGTWSLTVPVLAPSAAAACAAQGATHAAPRTGYENRLLGTAGADGQGVWLAVHRSTGWRGLDPR